MYGLSCLIPFFQQPNISRTSPVLLVTITICNHPVECDTLYHIFTQYGGTKEGPYQDRPSLCPFHLSPLLTCS